MKTGLKLKALLSLVVIQLLLPTFVACSSTPPSPPPDPIPVVPSGKEATINLLGQKLSFDTKTITVPAGAAVTVVFTNKESVVSHNLAVYESRLAKQVIFRGDFTRASKTNTYKFIAPSVAGTYFFRCDNHPALMTGDFVVTAE